MTNIHLLPETKPNRPFPSPKQPFPNPSGIIRIFYPSCRPNKNKQPATVLLKQVIQIFQPAPVSVSISVSVSVFAFVFALVSVLQKKLNWISHSAYTLRDCRNDHFITN